MPDPSFVFQGTVLALGESTVPIVEADELTARVRVDRVIRAPAAMESVVGREITIQLQAPASADMRAVFSADGWIYGESMAVVERGARAEVGERPAGVTAEAADTSMDELESPAARDRAAAFRSELGARLAEASRVVVGRVVAVGGLEAGPTTPGRLSEHDPNWTEATVEVEETMKGRAPRTIKVMFAGSQDVMWHDAPKLAVGQKAVMLLHRAPAAAGRRRANAVLHSLDVQPADAKDVVTGLM